MSFTAEVKNEIKDLMIEDEQRAFLQQVFLYGGSITDPEKEYHLEITTDNIETAQEINNVLKKFDIKGKIIEKKYKFEVYIKEAEMIALFLNIIGAHNALFKFENVKVLHEMNNSINRIVNCETANISKVVNTAVRQIEVINRIGIDNLPENLQEIANLRKDNPDASLKELGQMLKVPIGKSGVNHRLKKIKEIGEK